MPNISITQKHKGFSLLDTLVGVTIFALISIVIYQSYMQLTRIGRLATVKVAAASILTEEIETIRTLAYQDVGIQGGIPSGILPQTKNVTRNNRSFTVTLYIRSIDDAFDGTLGGSPNDTAPADYKLVDITISCTSCTDFKPFTSTTTVAPKALETTGGNGALFVRVFDAGGQPVPEARVTIINTALNPAINFTEITNQNGILQLVDVPPSIDSYQISVTKDGYSQDRTYPPDAPGNPNPLKPHASVVAGGVTQSSFAIDLLAKLTIQSKKNNCQSIGGISFNMTGAKLIGTTPDVIKYQQSHSTNAQGDLALQTVEWDTYDIGLTSATHYLAGSLPLTPVSVAPGAQDTLSLIVEPKTPNALLVEVRDAATQLPIGQAAIEITGFSYTKTLYSGEGFWQQTDWSQGSGQTDWSNPSQYFQDSGTLETLAPTGELQLKQNGPTYEPSGYLISSIYDNATPSNFYHLTVRPLDQPIETGVDPVRIQIASSNENTATTTWDFIGPDGTDATYYTPATATLNAIHNNTRYIRYKLMLQTADITYSPNVSDIAISYTSACTPSGQAYFNDIDTGSFVITVTKDGYQPFTEPLNVTNGWQKKTITLTPL